jgi:hypothetical protein
MNHSYCTIKAQIYRSASWYSTESNLFNVWSPGVIGGHNKVKHFYVCFNGGNLWKSFQKPREPKKVQIYWQDDLMAIKKSNVACVYRRNINQYDSGERCGLWASCFISCPICLSVFGFWTIQVHLNQAPIPIGIFPKKKKYVCYMYTLLDFIK